GDDALIGAGALVVKDVPAQGKALNMPARVYDGTGRLHFAGRRSARYDDGTTRMTLNVVSFYAPRPDHPFFQDYLPFLEILGESCRKYGHRHIIITDADLVTDAGELFKTEMPHNLMRAIIAGQLAYLKSPLAEDNSILVGADCVLARDPEEVFQQAFAVAFTTGPFTDCILNTGAIFTRGRAPVAYIWERALERMDDEWGDDQKALAAVVRPTLHPSVAAGPGLIIRFMPVDPYNLAPDHPGDDCRRGYILHFRGPRKAWMKDYCAKWLGVGKPNEWIALPNTPAEERFNNVYLNSKRDVLWVREEVPAHDGHAVLVGGGPSVANDFDEIVQRQRNGQTVFALNGAAHWLAGHWLKGEGRGFVPDYQVILDPRGGNVRFIAPPVARKYLIASQCHPSVFDALASEDVTLFHHAEDGIEGYFEGNPLVIGGGITVGLVAMALVYALGYRKLHLYGYDSSDRDGEGHAYSQAENNVEQHRREIWLDDKKFTCAPGMFAQANAFEGFARMMAEHDALITVHGTGLLPSIARKRSCLPF